MIGFESDEIELARDAILNHSEGTSDSWLGEILYDADKLEFLTGRSYRKHWSSDDWDRIKDFSEVSDIDREELEKYGIKRGIDIEYNTDLAKKLAVYKADFLKKHVSLIDEEDVKKLKEKNDFYKLIARDGTRKEYKEKISENEGNEFYSCPANQLKTIVKKPK